VEVIMVGRNGLCLVMAAVVLHAAGGSAEEPYRDASRDEKLAAARRVMERVRLCALITTDALGQPRARTMEPFPPEADFTVWLATNPLTRKVIEIRHQPRVALYYADGAAESYVTIMGRARIHGDRETKLRRRHRLVEKYWPAFPDDYALIEVRPVWLEVVAPGISNHPRTWRPQEVRFDR
jgi:general stress protein 26